MAEPADIGAVDPAGSVDPEESVDPMEPAGPATLPWMEPSGRAALGFSWGHGRMPRLGGPWSLRRKVLVVLAALLVAGLGLADALTYRTLHSSLLSREDSQLDALSRGAARELLTGSGVPLTFNQGFRGTQGSIQPFVEARDISGAVSGYIQASEGGQTLARPKLPRNLPSLPALNSSDPAATAVYFTVPSTKAGQASYRVRIGALMDGPLVVQDETLIVATPLSDVDATLHSLFLSELGVGAAALLLALLAGAWLVRLSLRPLEEMADTAGQIAAGQLSRRVPADGSNTEVGRLGSALNGMLSRIEGAFAEKEASEARLRRFVADASHELRTPLTSIRGYAELFRRGADRRPEDLAKAMRRIEDEASRMGLLVDDLLLLARLDQGRSLEETPVDLTALVAEAVDAARVVDPGRPIHVALGAAVVMGDRNRLRQVIDNLLVNVRVHTPPEAPAWVRLTLEGKDVVLEVEDRGPGIDPAVLAKVFERFYRADPARTHAGGGAGLGLAIVESIVSAQGGRVEAGPGDEGGARFRVILPAVEGPDRPDLASTPSAQKTQQHPSFR